MRERSDKAEDYASLRSQLAECQRERDALIPCEEQAQKLIAALKARQGSPNTGDWTNERAESAEQQLSECQRERDEARKAVERIPDYWKEAIGESYKPVKLGKLAASHPTTVKKALAEVAGTELADVIAALAFQACIAWEAQGLLGEQVTEEQKKRATAEQQLVEAVAMRDKWINYAFVGEVVPPLPNGRAKELPTAIESLQQQLRQMKEENNKLKAEIEMLKSNYKACCRG